MGCRFWASCLMRLSGQFVLAWVTYLVPYI